MNSSQIHLLTQINLADTARQVECSAASEIDVDTSLVVHITSVALKACVMENGMSCQPIVIYRHPCVISLRSEGRLMYDLLDSVDL